MQYYFRTDYCHKKADSLVNALSQFLNRSWAKEEMLKDENIQILYHLQILLTKVILARLSLLDYVLKLSLPHSVFDYKTYILPQLC